MRIKITVAAGAQETATTWADLQYMQQMTPSACSGGNETGKQLIDSRDGKSYWVAKLKDGNCWMTQNLDLDLHENIPLSPYDSDVAWNVYLSTTQTDTPSFSTDNNTIQSYDPGYKYCANNTTNACNLTTSTNNGHDAQGNYYSWRAATAGFGDTSIVTKDVNISYSICPKGWRLPPNSGNGSYATLFNGITTGSNLITTPYYFVYGGNVYHSSLYTAGSYGYYWSSTANSGTNAYYLYFNSSSVIPSSNDARYYGNSVRCVAR